MPRSSNTLAACTDMGAQQRQNRRHSAPGRWTGLACDLDNIRLVSLEKLEEVPLLTLADLLALQRVPGVPEAGFPFVFRDVESGMGGFHVAADIDARTTC